MPVKDTIKVIKMNWDIQQNTPDRKKPVADSDTAML